VFLSSSPLHVTWLLRRSCCGCPVPLAAQQLGLETRHARTVKHESEKVSFFPFPRGMPAAASSKQKDHGRSPGHPGRGQEVDRAQSKSAAARSQAGSGYQVPGAAAKQWPPAPAPEPTRPTWARTHPAIRRLFYSPGASGVAHSGPRRSYHRRQLGGGRVSWGII